MTPKFEKCVAETLKHEGGYVNNPNDKGGETKYGISKRSYSNVDIKNLTIDQAKAIYYRDYWQPSGAEELYDALALAHFDFTVNSGAGSSAKCLAQSRDFVTYNLIRLSWLTNLEQFPTFGRGWTRRVLDILNTGHKWNKTLRFFVPGVISQVGTVSLVNDKVYLLSAGDLKK